MIIINIILIIYLYYIIFTYSFVIAIIIMLIVFRYNVKILEVEQPYLNSSLNRPRLLNKRLVLAYILEEFMF